MLHKHCNLNKWQIWEYTLPQVTELMKSANKLIQFEVETRLAPFSVFGGGATEGGEDDEYKEATEEDIMLLAQALGGG